MLMLTEKDITTKDGRILSPKQVNCLYKYFKLDLEKTLKYIQDNNYEEISKKIGNLLGEWSKISHERSLEIIQGKGDRGFDDDPFYEYHCPYTEGDLC